MGDWRESGHIQNLYTQQCYNGIITIQAPNWEGKHSVLQFDQYTSLSTRNVIVITQGVFYSKWYRDLVWDNTQHEVDSWKFLVGPWKS